MIQLSQSIRLIVAGVSMIILTACASQAPSSTVQPGETSPSSSPTSSPITVRPTSPSPDNGDSATTTRPVTKVATLSLEGESEAVQMQLFNDPTVPFTTYFPPDDFVPEVGSSDEGLGVRFIWTAGGVRDEDVYLMFAFPATPQTPEQIREFLTSEQGLIATNGWTITNTQTEDLPADWANEAIAYQDTTGDRSSEGLILIGEHNGAAFYSIMHYPVEYTEGFYPRAALVLDHLEFR